MGACFGVPRRDVRYKFWSTSVIWGHKAEQRWLLRMLRFCFFSEDWVIIDGDDWALHTLDLWLVGTVTCKINGFCIWKTTQSLAFIREIWDGCVAWNLQWFVVLPFHSDTDDLTVWCLAGLQTEQGDGEHHATDKLWIVKSTSSDCAGAWTYWRGKVPVRGAGGLATALGGWEEGRMTGRQECWRRHAVWPGWSAVLCWHDCHWWAGGDWQARQVTHRQAGQIASSTVLPIWSWLFRHWHKIFLMDTFINVCSITLKIFQMPTRL